MPEGTESTQGTVETVSPPNPGSPNRGPSGAVQDTTGDTSPPEAVRGPWYADLAERFFGMGKRPESVATASEPSSADDGADEPAGPAEAAPEPPGQPPPAKREVTDEELERLVQAETDRREAKRKARPPPTPGPAQQAADLEAQAHQVRRDNPDQANDLFDQAEAIKAQQQFVGGIVQLHDQATMGALWEAVPEADRPTVFAADEAATPLELRTKHVKAALAHLKRVWTAEGAAAAEKKLRASPAFVQQVALERRTAGDTEDDDPELLVQATPSRNGRSTGEQANDAIRELIRARR